MKYLILLLLLLLAGCSLFKRNVSKPPTYNLYPYNLVSDTDAKSSIGVIVPIRVCSDNLDTITVFFHDLAGIKYNRYKTLTYQEFDSLIVKKIFNGECLDIIPDEYDRIYKISLSEYKNQNPDTLLKKYFPKSAYKLPDEDINELIPRDVMVAFLVLFDNKYIVSLCCAGEVHLIKKAPTDAVILKYDADRKKKMKKNKRPDKN